MIDEIARINSPLVAGNVLEGWKAWLMKIESRERSEVSGGNATGLGGLAAGREGGTPAKVPSKNADHQAATGKKNKGGRPSLQESTNPKDQAKLNVYKLIRVEQKKQPTWKPPDFLNHFKNIRDVKDTLKAADHSLEVAVPQRRYRKSAAGTPPSAPPNHWARNK